VHVEEASKVVLKKACLSEGRELFGKRGRARWKEPIGVSMGKGRELFSAYRIGVRVPLLACTGWMESRRAHTHMG